MQPARDLYRAFGIDPTRTRPSSEALLRRVMQGKGMPRIRGAVTLRRGRPGESYQGIRKDEVHLEGRPVLADDDGAFGNPTSDSLRTSVTDATRSIWMVIFAPAEYEAARMRAHVDHARRLIETHLTPPGEATGATGHLLT